MNMAATETGNSGKGFRGIHVLWIVLGTILITAAVTFWAVRTYIYAKDFKPVELSVEEQHELNGKLRVLGYQPEPVVTGSAEETDQKWLRPEAYDEIGARREVTFSERELNALIAERLRTRPTAAWVEELNLAGVPCGPVYRMDEVFADPQVEHLAMTEPVEHPALGRLDILRNAVRMTDAPATVRAPSPDAGDHTGEVLAELGYPRAEIDRLRAEGVI